MRQTSARLEETGDTTSVHLPSEHDSASSLGDHLHALADSLNLLCRESSHPRKEAIYRQVLIFVSNLKRFELDTDLILRIKIGRYLSVIYNLLLKLNDYKDDSYCLLLVETSTLIASIKNKVLQMVDDRSGSSFPATSRVVQVSKSKTQTRSI